MSVTTSKVIKISCATAIQVFDLTVDGHNCVAEAIMQLKGKSGHFGKAWNKLIQAISKRIPPSKVSAGYHIRVVSINNTKVELPIKNANDLERMFIDFYVNLVEYVVLTSKYMHVAFTFIPSIVNA